MSNIEMAALGKTVGLKTMRRGDNRVMTGGDFEFFAVKNGVVVPADARDFFKDKKYFRGVNNFCFADGVQVEINFEPTLCRDVIISCVSDAMSMARDTALMKGCELSCVSGVTMTQRQIDEGGYLSHVMGCNPDFSAYTDVPNTPLKNFETHPNRWAGYHVQLGVNVPERQEKNFARLMDRTVGLVSGWGDKDASHRIRKGDGIGLAGCYRNHPPTRFEYRTPGSYWARTPFLTHIILGVARYAANTFLAGAMDEFNAIYTDQEIRAAINNCDNAECKRLLMRAMPFYTAMSEGCDRYNALSMHNAEDYIGFDYNTFPFAVTSYVMDEGAESLVPQDGRHNWHHVIGLLDLVRIGYVQKHTINKFSEKVRKEAA